MVALSAEERALADGADGPARAMALRIVAETARVNGARRLVPIVSAHVDGCLDHGDAGLAFAARLVEGGGRVAVPTTLNVGALDLLHPGRVRAAAATRRRSHRLMAAYRALGCRPSWTCAPYQAGHRPPPGAQVAWGESNAIAFVNSVLGARSERYGDFIDIAAAIAGRAPDFGLHRDENRRARLVVDVGAISDRLKASDVFYPVFGAWLGATVGATVAVIEGLPPRAVSEDRLKALGAAAASTGAVALFHVAGVTPEAPDVASAGGGAAPRRRIALDAAALRAARDALSTVGGEAIDAVAVGSPHFSAAEFAALDRLIAGRRLRVPLYACTGRHALAALEAEGRLAALARAGVEIVTDTCIVVAPILPARAGVLMTNSAKFATYAPANTGWAVVFGSLEDCVASACAGRVMRDESLWT